MLEDIRKGKKLKPIKKGAEKEKEDESSKESPSKKDKQDKKKKKHDSKGVKKSKKVSSSSSSSEEENADEEEVPIAVAGGLKPSQVKIGQRDTLKMEQKRQQEQIQEEQSAIVELLDEEIDQDLPQWKRKLMQKKKLKEYQPLLSEQQKAKDEETR